MFYYCGYYENMWRLCNILWYQLWVDYGMYKTFLVLVFLVKFITYVFMPLCNIPVLPLTHSSYLTLIEMLGNRECQKLTCQS